MANTYTQLYVQIVFTTKNKINLIKERNRDELEKYICGIINNNKSKPLSIYCNPDHIHILVSLNPKTSVSELVQVIKSNSSKWINERNWVSRKFRWQNGFGAFSYSHSHLDNVIKYIENQPIHHKKSTYEKEYTTLLEKYEVEYDEQYAFDKRE